MMLPDSYFIAYANLSLIKLACVLLHYVNSANDDGRHISRLSCAILT